MRQKRWPQHFTDLAASYAQTITHPGEAQPAALELSVRPFPRLVGGPRRLLVHHELFAEAGPQLQVDTAGQLHPVDEQGALADLADALKAEASARCVLGCELDAPRQSHVLPLR